MKTIKQIIKKKEVISQFNKPLKNKSKKILLYLDHFLIAKRIEMNSMAKSLIHK